MRRWISILALLFILSPAAFPNNNQNAWSPSPDIPNIYLVELYTFHGLPRNTVQGREIKILVNHGYAVGYSEELKVPLYAVYRYGNLQESAEQLTERSFERPPKFQVDLPTTARVTTDDYTNSGYDRGHMAPNYGLRTQYGHLAQIETLFVSNIVPQRPSLNRYTWASAERKIVEELAQDDRDPDDPDDDICDVWVISGPVFEGQTQFLGQTQIAIPTGFFKIIVRRNHYGESSARAIALYYPQEPAQGEDKEQFVTVDSIEQKTGLDFHPNLVDSTETNLENKKRGWDWEEIDD